MNRSIEAIYPQHRAEVVPGASLSRPFPRPELRMVDPFLMIDHGPPRYFHPGQKIHVPPHPHRGLAPVSLLFRGEIEHRDSEGHHGIAKSGDVQWMTAGSGIVHEEILRPENRTKGGVLHAMQLWVNLPASKKFVEPSYQHIVAHNIPTVIRERVSARVITGEAFGKQGPIATYSPMLILHIEMKPNSEIQIPIPDSFNAVVYAMEGSVQTNHRDVQTLELVHYGSGGDTIALEANEANNLLLLAGEPLGEPVVSRGPFVLNTEAQARQAFLDYKKGRMGRMPA